MTGPWCTAIHSSCDGCVGRHKICTRAGQPQICYGWGMGSWSPTPNLVAIGKYWLLGRISSLQRRGPWEASSCFSGWFYCPPPRQGNTKWATWVDGGIKRVRAWSWEEKVVGWIGRNWGKIKGGYYQNTNMHYEILNKIRGVIGILVLVGHINLKNSPSIIVLFAFCHQK